MKTIIAILPLIFCVEVGFAQDALPPDRVMSQSLIEEFGKPPLGAAEVGRARPLPNLALELIKDFEGWVDHAYNDPVGYCTIGYGHLIALERCENVALGEFSQPITLERGEEILLKDTVGARLAVTELVVTNLTDDQFGALSSFVFNVGKRNFANSTLLRLLNRGDQVRAAEEFPRWVRARNVVLQGLVDRRACERDLFKGKLSAGASNNFDRRACTSLGIAALSGSLLDIETGE